MELYNSTIREVKESLASERSRSWAYEPSAAWRDLGQNELVLTRDAAYELGGSALPASNFTCVTTDASLVPEDRRGSLEEELTDGTNGKALLEEAGKCFYGDIEGKIQVLE